MATNCPKCGLQNESKILFCGGCGASISGSSENERELINFVSPDGVSSAPQAWRNERFWAASIDALFLVPLIVFGEWIRGNNLSIEEVSFTIKFLVVIPTTVLMIVQAVKLAKYGQTIGKQFLKIRIVGIKDGKNKGFWINCVLRVFPILMFNFIPVLGYLINWGDALYIYRNKQRRCIHDLIAGTCVIKD